MAPLLVRLTLLALCSVGVVAQGRGKCVADCHEFAFERDTGVCNRYSAGKLYKACGSAHREGVKQACSQICSGKPVRELSLRVDKACNHLREALPKPTMHQSCVAGYQNAFDITSKLTEAEMDQLRTYMKPGAKKPAAPAEPVVATEPEVAKSEPPKKQQAPAANSRQQEEKVVEPPAPRRVVNEEAEVRGAAPAETTTTTTTKEEVVAEAPPKAAAAMVGEKKEHLESTTKIGKVPINLPHGEGAAAKEMPKVVLAESSRVNELLNAGGMPEAKKEEVEEVVPAAINKGKVVVEEEEAIPVTKEEAAVDVPAASEVVKVEEEMEEYEEEGEPYELSLEEEEAVARRMEEEEVKKAL